MSKAGSDRIDYLLGGSLHAAYESGFRLTERRRSRTDRAVGYTTALVLKPCKNNVLSGLFKPDCAIFAAARASLRAGPATN